jgi:hypothetical protein
MIGPTDLGCTPSRRQSIVFGGSVGSGSPVIPRSASDSLSLREAESPLAKVEIPSLRSE